MTQAAEDRRAAVLRRAVHFASVEGLEGLTLGRLAAGLDATKSSLQSLFGSKQELQLAIVAAAQDVFQEQVIRPAEEAEDGVARARALLHNWIGYLGTFEGGCFFVTAAVELDGRPGPVRDRITELTRAGLSQLHRQLRLAVRLGELPSGTDVDQLVFELHGTVLEANFQRQLLGQADAGQRARAAVDRLLGYQAR